MPFLGCTSTLRHFYRVVCRSKQKTTNSLLFLVLAGVHKTVSKGFVDLFLSLYDTVITILKKTMCLLLIYLFGTAVLVDEVLEDSNTFLNSK